MPAVARKNGIDQVSINHATCQGSTTTDAGSDDVLVNNVGVVRQADQVQSHTHSPPACPQHSPGLSSFSSTVFVNNKAIGRLGDAYGCGATISSGSANVFAG
jgi:uncharacterized Zn-binding protein involved in type VI secretion